MTQWTAPPGGRELVMFGDYECPHTRDAWRHVETLLARSGGRLRLGWRHYPVPHLHPHGMHAAEVAEAAAAQGDFWTLHRRLFAHQDEGLEDERLLAHARAAGLDADRIAAELRDGAHVAAVRADKQAGREIGLRRTPTFVVDGERWDGFYDVETLSELVA
jgi:NhaA family Na+:H+ antiporter